MVRFDEFDFVFCAEHREYFSVNRLFISQLITRCFDFYEHKVFDFSVLDFQENEVWCTASQRLPSLRFVAVDDFLFVLINHLLRLMGLVGSGMAWMELDGLGLAWMGRGWFVLPSLTRWASFGRIYSLSPFVSAKIAFHCFSTRFCFSKKLGQCSGSHARRHVGFLSHFSEYSTNARTSASISSRAVRHDSSGGSGAILFPTVTICCSI